MYARAAQPGRHVSDGVSMHGGRLTEREITPFVGTLNEGPN
jgi:hypothetical protein